MVPFLRCTNYSNIFRLPGRYIGKMDTSQYFMVRYRAVNLHKAEPVYGGTSKLIITESFKKAPTVNAVYPGSDDPCTVDTKWFHLHPYLKRLSPLAAGYHLSGSRPGL